VDRAVVFIHGCDKSNSSKNFDHWFAALVHYDLRAVAIDMPGYGNSPGERHSFRTRHILDTDGPADVVTEVIKELGLIKPAIFGYDWGASIAMRSAIRYPNSFSKVISFMPAYGEPPDAKDELKKLKLPTLVWWMAGDSLHVWPKFKKFAELIPNVEIDLHPTPNWKASMAPNTY
jgi:pimeloyl-ACP methyl ester carboxylesterase